MTISIAIPFSIAISIAIFLLFPKVRNIQANSFIQKSQFPKTGSQNFILELMYIKDGIVRLESGETKNDEANTSQLTKTDNAHYQD